MPKVYLSGRMRGIPDYNFPAFRAATSDLRQRGFEVISPAELDQAAGVEPSPNGDDCTPDEYASFLARDIDVMAREKVKGVVVLEGWEQSGGAKTEVAFARALGLPVMRYPGLEPVAEPGATANGSGTGEVRVVDPVTGGAKGQKLARFDLIPPDALKAIAEHFGRGARKYADRNWERGYDWSLTFGALNRHLWAFWHGEDMDPDSDEAQPHLAAVAWHAMVLLAFYLRGAGNDDRPRVPTS